jgi:hypothetical protein
VRAGSKTKLHPSQNYIYAADNGLSPSDIEKYDISNGSLEYMYDSPYHGDYAMCGDLWISNEGLRIFTACGNVFRSSSVQETDMSYNGQLQVSGVINSLAHLDGRVAYLDSDDLSQLHYSEYEVLSYLNSEKLGVYNANEESFSTSGDFVFYLENGTPFVVSTISSDSQLLHTSAIQYQPSELETANLIPTAIVSENQYVLINEQLEISGEASFDPEGETLAYSWEILDAPEGSVIQLSNDNTPTVILIPDLKGEYTIQLTVSDEENNSSPVTMKVVVEDPDDRVLTPLDFQVLDAEFSTALDKVIMLSGSTNQIMLFDVETKVIETIDLNFSAEIIELNSSGTKAIAGRTNEVATIDLENLIVEQYYTTSIDLADIVYADNGYAYLFPATDQWSRIKALNLQSGEESDHTGFSIYAGTVAELHSSGNYIYGADNGLSPSDIELYDISNGNAEYVKDSPYHGDYDMCGDLWMSNEGSRIFTRCGNVFVASPETDEDMGYAGSLNTANNLLSVSHFDNEVVLVMEDESWGSGTIENGSTFIQFFSFDNLSFTRRLDLPTVEQADVEYNNLGKELFHNANGEKIIVLLQTEADAGILNDYSLFVYTK